MDGHLIVYLNLDEVIKIIRDNDEPKPLLIKRFSLTEVQAEAILNMRLRSLRKLEEMEIRKEHTQLSKEQKGLQSLMKDEGKKYQKLTEEFSSVKEIFSKKTKLGKRRSEVGDAVETPVVEVSAFIEKEPITVLLSEKGWVRAMKGHLDLQSDFTFKEGDQALYTFHSYTTDKILFFAKNGKFFTLPGDKLPSGRGFGEPINLMIDLQGHDIVTAFTHQPERKLFVGSKTGHGFIVAEDDVLAQTRTGKSILNVAENDQAVFCLPADKKYVAVIGNNRKLLIFKTEEIPQLNRGRGVIIQKYGDAKGELSDVRFFEKEDGLTFSSRGQAKKVDDIRLWLGKRAQVGRTPPDGFPRKNKFE